uniref:ATP-dependent DNA helicase 2 subunit 1 n=1 Tax=Rhodosorus marinus TaxID=101924 RepID=A0A6T6KC51_9RHOD|mmetsp:Transcript_10212/g.14776  ORF Transcript_10212/g.14776 Transcript_10212/m.14776 type:complete len:674 (+) Transcript_10212:484-2505(+)
MMAEGGGLDLDFDRDEWDGVEEDREELTLQSLFHSTNNKLASTQGSQTSEGSEPFFLPDELIFLIDFRESMATSVDEDGNGLLSSCLRCAAEVLKDKIISREYDLVGVLGFGTEKTDNSNSFSNICVVRSLGISDAVGILDLENLSKDPILVHERYGHGASDSIFSFHQALWTCRSMFAQSKVSRSMKSRRRVFILTNDDDPAKGDESQRTQSAVQARDLLDAGASIELFCLGTAGTSKKFDAEKFFNDIILRTDTDDGNLVNVPVSRFPEIKRRLKNKQHRKRIEATCYIHLADDKVITLAGFFLIRKATRSRAVALDAKNNKPVRRQTSTWSSETAEILHPRDIGYGYSFASTIACLGDGERRSLKMACSSNRFRCLGFINLETVPWDLLSSHPLFLHPLFPEERSWTESLKAQSALFASVNEEMEKKGLAMLVYGSSSRSGSLNRFAAVLPQREEVVDDVQVVPSGWLLVFLPYAEDLRQDYITPSLSKDAVLGSVDLSAEQQQVASDLLGKFHVPEFDPGRYTNPDLQQYYNGLQALALGQQTESTERTIDTMLPDDDGMEDEALEEIARFQLAFGLSAGGNVEFSTETHVQSEANSARKRARLEAVEAARKFLAREKVDWESKANDDSLAELPVVVLKQYCLVNGLKVTGKNKSELLDLVRERILHPG